MDQGDILDRIKKVMREKGIKQTFVAKSLGLTDGGLSKIMKGGTHLTVETLLQIAKVLDVDPTSLIPSSESGRPGQSFEDYVRSIIQDECDKKYQPID